MENNVKGYYDIIKNIQNYMDANMSQGENRKRSLIISEKKKVNVDCCQII